MTPQQAEAYVRLVAILEQENGVTLRPKETELLRAAADALFFDEEDARDARDRAQDVLDALLESGRWGDERIANVAACLDSCGNLAVAA